MQGRAPPRLPHENDRLERLARYLTRAPVKLSSLSWHHGRVRVETPPDPRTGATHALLDTIDLIHQIASQIPDRGLHLTRYYGAYANRTRRTRFPTPTSAIPAPDDDAPFLKARRASWARLVRRIFEADPLLCPRCGDTMDLIAVITQPSVVDRILRHIRTLNIADPFDTARAPPHPSTRASIA